MAKYLVNDTSLTAVADAIRTKGGTSEALSFPDGFVSAVEGIQAGGGDVDPISVARSILDKSITEYIDNELTIVPDYGFRACKNLVTLHTPNVTKIGQHGFRYCESLKYANFDKVTTFRSIECTFDGCKSLISASLESAGDFQYGANTFRDCSSLTDVYMPNAYWLSGSTFKNCAALEHLDFPHVRTIENNCFTGCSVLKVLVLRNQSVCTLNASNSFDNSPFASGGTGGVLLIPSALVESYKTATNWSVLYGYGTNRFLALEDYTIDGTTTGEIDWDKVNALF